MKNKIKIEKLEKISPRDIWETEPKFSDWLFDNIETLGEKLNMRLTATEREKRAGDFKADIIAEDETGQKVLIENQLSLTNHEHLGKIITYLANLDVKIAIWISSNPRSEHEKVIDWLNEFGPGISFYLVKVETYKLKNILTVIFNVISEPTEEAKIIGEEKKEYAQTDILRKDFWTKLLDKARDKTKLHANVSPNIWNWVGAGAGRAGITYQYVISNKYGGCEIYFDRGKEYADPNINKIRFDKLYRYKDKIERILGEKLSWERLNNARASRIAIYFEDGGLRNKEKWDNLQDKMINAMVRIENVFKEYIQHLK